MSIENNLLRANDLLGRGKLNDALLAVQDVLRTAPRHASAHHLQARLLWSLGRKQDALGAAHAAQQLDPQSAGIAAQLGEFYVELRLPEFALASAARCRGARACPA
jgi:Flp pilus assembly protein TadD